MAAWTTPKTDYQPTDPVTNLLNNTQNTNLQYLKDEADGIRQDFDDNVNQGVKSTDSPTFANPTVTTLNTGHGANELYEMDQDVKTTDKPTFAGMKLTETGNGVIDLLSTGIYTFSSGFWQMSFDFSGSSGDGLQIEIYANGAWENLAKVTNSGGSILASYL